MTQKEQDRAEGRLKDAQAEVEHKLKQAQADSKERMERMPVPLTDEQVRRYMATGKLE